MPVPISVIASSTVSRPSRSRRARAVALCSNVTADRGRDTETDEPAPVADAGRLCNAFVPPEAGGTLAQRFGEMARGERNCRLGIDLVCRFGAATPPDLTPRASASSSIAHSSASRPIASPGARIESDRGRSSFARRCRVKPVGRGIEHAGCSADRLDVVVKARALHKRVLAIGGQSAVAVCAEPQALLGCGAMGGHVKELGPRHRHFHRSTKRCGHQSPRASRRHSMAACCRSRRRRSG